MSIKVLLNHTIWLTINHLLGRGVLMISAIFLAKYMVSKDFALYSYYQMTVTMIASYASLGLGLAASKYYAEHSNENEKNKKIINSLSNISIYAAFFIAFLILVLPEKNIFHQFDIPIYIFTLTILFLVLNIVPNGAVMGLERYKILTIISFISSLVFLIGVFISIYFGNIYIIIYFYLFSLIFQYFGQRFVILDILPFNTNFKLDVKVFRDIIKFIGPMFFVSIISAFSIWIMGRTILNKLDEFSFAVYAIGLQWFSLALFLPGMISRVILPMVIRNQENNADKEILKMASIVALIFSILISLFLFLFIDLIIGFYGGKYYEYKNFILFFVIVSLFYAPANTLGNAIVAKVGSSAWFYITVIWMIFLLSIFFIGIRIGGLYSIIYAHGFASFIMLLISFIICKKKGIL